MNIKLLKKHLNDEIQISNDTELLNFDDMIEMYDPETDDYPIQLQSKRPFSDEEDILLLNLVETVGRKWKKMESHFTQRTSLSLRNPWVHLRK